MEADDQKLLMASDAGYGFICTFNDLVSRNRAGKALISLPDNARHAAADHRERKRHAAGDHRCRTYADVPGQRFAGAVERQGQQDHQYPVSGSGKGEDSLAHLFLLPPQSTLTIHVGKRKIKLRPEELQKVVGERGRRGSLMRGLQRIDRVEIDSPARSKADDSEE